MVERMVERGTAEYLVIGGRLVEMCIRDRGMVPGLILAPGWSHTPTVAAALQAKTENINGNFNCSCLLDISADSDGAVVYTSVKGAKEALGASSAHAAACLLYTSRCV